MQKAAELPGPGVPPVRYLFSGDLLGQLIATSFGVMDLKLPLFGLYGACSTIGEALMLGAMTVQGGYSEAVLALTSSHFGSAEKQFRFPLGLRRPASLIGHLDRDRQRGLSYCPAAADMRKSPEPRRERSSTTA